jgi:hypothetical protein
MVVMEAAVAAEAEDKEVSEVVVADKLAASVEVAVEEDPVLVMVDVSSELPTIN